MRAWVLVINAASTLAMAGLIWLVQLVHYPTFSFIHEPDFVSFAVLHQMRISIVVVPLMLLELITTVLLLRRPHPAFTGNLARAAAACLVVAWLSTFLWQAPIHQQLLQGRSATLITDLIEGNWLRTIAWSARAILVCFALQRCVQSASENLAAPTLPGRIPSQ